MDKYRLLCSRKGEGGNFMEDSSSCTDATKGGVAEVKITQKGKPRDYISYAINLFVSILLS